MFESATTSTALPPAIAAGDDARRADAWRARWPWLVLLLAGWLVVVAIAIGVSWRFMITPGRVGPHPEFWPTATTLARAAEGPTLVVFLHPRCACSFATVHELTRLIERVPKTPRVDVVFLGNAAAEPPATRGELWSAAASVPGAMLSTDDQGREARRFGAFTSGQTLLYDADGRLRYAGGLTLARGHEGDNMGRRRVAALLAGTAAPSGPEAVYGCPLVGDEVADADTLSIKEDSP